MNLFESDFVGLICFTCLPEILDVSSYMYLNKLPVLTFSYLLYFYYFIIYNEESSNKYLYETLNIFNKLFFSFIIFYELLLDVNFLNER